jgi:pimeloyl-ACP methyl ester carboxylesterase
MASAEDCISWLEELFDGLLIKEGINIVGLSYGGWITIKYAQQFPNRVNKVVLLAPVGTVAQLSLEWIARAVLVALPFKYFARNFIYWLAEDTITYREDGPSLVEEHVDETFLAVRSFKGRRIVNPTVLSDGELKNIRVPILLWLARMKRYIDTTKYLSALTDSAL